MNIPNAAIERVGSGNLPMFRRLLEVLSETLEDGNRYRSDDPSDAYLRKLLQGGRLVALAATVEGEVIGGLVAYELRRYQERLKEFYLYDLAVVGRYRRRGVATALIAKLGTLASARGSSTIFVQADRADLPAIKLYSQFGVKRAVFHFEITAPKEKPSGDQNEHLAGEVRPVTRGRRSESRCGETRKGRRRSSV